MLAVNKNILVKKDALELNQAQVHEHHSDQSKQQKGIRIVCTLVDSRQNTSLQTVR